VRKLFFLCMCSLFLFVGSLCVAEAAKPPLLAELFMASGVNPDGSPGERVTAYPPEAPLLAVFAECRNVSAGMKVRFVWYFAPPGKEKLRFAEYTAKNPVRQKAAIFHSTVSLEKEWPEGDYYVEARLDGEKKMKTVRFSVKKGEAVSSVSAGGVKMPPAAKEKQDTREQVYFTGKDTALEKEERARSETKLAEKEAVFRKNPADISAVLNLADAYAAMNDAASVSLALALYKGLAESSPSDMILARLADAYARLSLFDRAFTTALRRSWNPLVSPEGPVSQILLLAGAGGDWERGIDCLQQILAGREDEREVTLLALAALYVEKSRVLSEKEKRLRDEYRSAAAACLDEAEASLPRSSGMWENLLRLRKELEELCAECG